MGRSEEIRLRVPQAHAESFRRFVTLDPQERERFLDALSRAPSALLLKELTENVASHLEAAQTDIGGHIEVLAGLYVTRLGTDLPIDEFVQKVCEAGRTLIKEEKDLDRIDWDSFRKQLSRALALDDPLGVTSKAFELATEHDKVFTSTRIFTDIRPVFRVDPTESPAAAVIVHTLKISYYENGEERNVYFALDNEDIEVLEKALKRAKEKNSSLKQLLDRAQLRALR